ncbi:LOW QUALITY PROTEIN: Cys regulon transcriptional activator CysB [Geomicrobium sp. JCM 19039]|nr:LOW QUALITY PROTEIN: Cys regulon transcriptional activator CysB [Geomicrobium sp. JCM 19039]
MNEKDWILLQTLYEVKSITKTAEMLYISQPAITYRLSSIEREFGIEIAKRSNKGLKFTSEGEYLVHYFEKMSRELEKTKDWLLNMGKKNQGNLRLGVSSTFSYYRLPEILKKFMEEFPNIQVEVTTGWSSAILKKLEDEKIHIGIIRGGYDWKANSILISKENVCLISKDKIDIKKTSGHETYFFDRSNLLELMIKDWWNNNFKLPPQIVMDVDRIETCKEMVRHGLGYGIIPGICLQPKDQFYTYNLKINDEDLIRKTWMIYSEDSLESPVVNAFVQYLTAHIHNGEVSKNAVDTFTQAP